MRAYLRKVQYHETDKMGITHHANYIKWMEEARIDFLEQLGFGYAKLEADGIISPVTAVDCRYQQPTTFDDTVEIAVCVAEFRGVRLVIDYVMKNAVTGQVVLTGKTQHCFLSHDGKPLILKRQFPEFDRALRQLAAEREET